MMHAQGLLLAAVLAFAGSSAPAQTTTRVSIATSGAQGNGESWYPSISADGRFVAFRSDSFNLVAGDTNGWSDIFVHDRQTGETERVSVATGGGQGNRWSHAPSISSDGRFVTFYSVASNLVADDTNGWSDVFIHDRQTGETQRVSVAAGGAQGTGDSRFPSISADGRFVAFESTASNLVPMDTNLKRDIFVHDRQAGGTQRISIATGGAQASADSSTPCISADGRFVAFASSASDLVPDDPPPTDVFVHDRQTGETTLVSVAKDGETEFAGGGWAPSISADGHLVAFHANGPFIFPGGINVPADVFVHNRQMGQTNRVSIATDGVPAGSGYPSISADGRFVAFVFDTLILSKGGASDVVNIFVHDRRTGESSRVSISSGGAQANGWSRRPSISANGRFVAFDSDASNLVPGDTNSDSDIFIHDRCATFPCSGDADGNGAVSFPDITSTLENWAADFVPCTVPGDANRDSFVSFADITKVLEHWGTTCR